MRRPTLLAVLLAAITASWGGPRPAPHQTITRRYEVQLAFTGYTGLAESADCRALVDLQGYDSLVGTLTGVETPNQPDEDMVYTGTLQRRTRIDYCETKPAPTSDQLAWCVAKLTGAAPMDVEVTVYGEADRGAWMKAGPAKSPPDSVKVAGNCLQADMDSIRVDYPSGESAGSPDGQPIEENPASPFFANRLARLRAGAFYPAKPPESAWSLRVVRAVP
jgi:hypothetical protein